MPTFLSDLPIYNAKASLAITQAGLDGDTGKANLMSSLKTTANDLTLSSDLRLNALTALINVGNLLDIPLPPYFPIAVTYANTVTYVGLHDNLTGLQGGGPGEYYHLTSSERNNILGKVSPDQLRFANLVDSPLDNPQLDSILIGKQNALSGPGFVKANSGVITYDDSTYLTNISTIAAGGDLGGFYPNPTISSSVVMGKQMAGWNPSYPSGTGAISSADTLLVAIQKLNVSLSGIIANPSGVSSVALNLLPNTIFDSTTTPASGAVVLGASFKSQSANTFLAAPNGSAGTPTFRVMAPDDVPNLGVSPAGTYGGGSPLQIPVITVDAKGRVTAVSLTAATGSGTVTSVGIDPPSYISAGAAITTSGNISLAWQNTITPNYVFAGPNSGSTAGAPTFRPLVALDIPNIAISQVTNLQSELDSKMTFLLNDGEIWIGNASNAPTNQSLTGDVTMTRDGVVTIENEAVTFAKMQNITSGNILGRWDASTPGPIQQISLSADFNLDSGTGILSLAVPVAPILNSKGGLITYRQSIGQQVQLTAVFDGNLLITDSAEDDGLKWVTAQGDIEVDAALDGTFNILPGVVTLGKMATLAANSFIGNNTGSSATPIALSVTQATAMLNQFTTSAKGLVPAASFTPVSPNTLADYFLNAAGGWSLGGGGGGSGTVTTVSVVSANGFAGTVANATTTPAITLTTSITGLLKGNGTAISAATAGTDYAPATSGTSILYGNGAGGFSNVSIGTGLSFSTGTLSASGSGGTVTSVGLTMPSAFSVSIPTITTSGTFAVTGAGTVSQYIRGDGTLGIFPSIGGGGGGSVYYLNGGVTASPSSIGGVAMKQLSKAPITSGVSVDFTANTNGATIASFLTDTGDPNQTSIPAGIWIFECYLSAAGSGPAHPTVQAVVETWDGTTLSVIATGVAEEITNGTTKDLYQFAATIPTGITISATDRIVVQIKVVAAASKTITLYTQNGNVSSVTTTFPNAIVSLNSLTAGTQLFANGSSGTAPAFVSSIATHTLNIPLASSANTVTAGLISYAEYTGKLTNPLTATGDIIYSSSGTTAAALPIGTLNQVLSVSAGGLPEWKTIAAGGDVTGPAGPVIDGNFAVFDSTTGKIIKESAGASLSATGGATFNDGVEVGVSSSTTGTLVFRNSSNAFTTTLQASTGAAANLIYTWPTAAPAIGNILSSDGSGNLSWTAAGAGNMVLATAGQIVTGSKIYSDGTLLIRNPAQTFSTTLSAGTSLAARTITFPDLTGTVALLDNAQTFTGAKTFQAQVNIGNATYAASTLSFGGTTSNAIGFPAAGTAVPAIAGARTAGVRIALAPPGNYFVNVDFAIGMASSTEMYIGTSGATNTEVSMYFGATKLGAFYSAGLAVRGGGLLVNTGASTTTGVGNALSTLIFSTSVSAAPSNQNARSNGTRIVLQSNTGVGSVDAAIGYNDTQKETWITGAQTTTTEGKISFYSSNIAGALYRVGYFGNSGLIFDGTTSGGIATGINFSNSGNINWGTSGSAAPSNGNTRVAGTKLVLRSNVAVNSVDYAIGVDSANYETWITGGSTSATNGGMVSFWVGLTPNFKRTVWITENALNLTDSGNIVLQTTTGTKIATATTQKLAFWNKTPIVQPTTGITGATRVGGAGTTVTTTDTYGGYTIAQIAAALVNTGILA